MRKEIEVSERKIEYSLRRSARARRMRLTVYCDGNFVVTAPHLASEGIIERFIMEKSRWIIEKIDYFKSLGPQSLLRSTRGDYERYKHEAQLLAERKVGEFNAIYQFSFNTITIKNQKTRWGSCSSHKNLNFNYRILFLSPELQDYLVVHELCHLGEMNHSRQFWQLVARTIPNYRKLRNELRNIHTR